MLNATMLFTSALLPAVAVYGLVWIGAGHGFAYCSRRKLAFGVDQRDDAIFNLFSIPCTANGDRFAAHNFDSQRIENDWHKHTRAARHASGSAGSADCRPDIH